MKHWWMWLPSAPLKQSVDEILGENLEVADHSEFAEQFEGSENPHETDKVVLYLEFYPILFIVLVHGA